MLEPSMIKNPYRVVLTGGIASGKSTIAKLFKALGINIVDADKIARDIVQPQKEGWYAVKEHFKDSFFDDNGQIIREKLRHEISTQPQQKILLESLLHPIIKKEMLSQCHHCRSQYLLLDIPLFAENFHQYQRALNPNENSNKFSIPNGKFFYHRVLVIDIEPSTQIDRLMQRDAVTETQALKLIQMQADPKKRKQLADDILYNNDDVKKLNPEVINLHKKYLALANNMDKSITKN